MTDNTTNKWRLPPPPSFSSAPRGHHSVDVLTRAAGMFSQLSRCRNTICEMPNDGIGGAESVSVTTVCRLLNNVPLVPDSAITDPASTSACFLSLKIFTYGTINSLCSPQRLLRVQELCESRGGRHGPPILTSLVVSVDVKQH